MTTISKTPANINKMLANALNYAAKGYKVFPVKARAKTPLTANGFLDASNDPEQIKAWWQQWPDANIGLRTGGNFFVVDIDGAQGEASIKALEAAHGRLPATVEVITGSGGRHLYFAAPADGLPIKCSTSKIGRKVDIRADGGYVVAPPSMHPCGRGYALSVDSADSLAAAPEWLVKLARGIGTKNPSGAPKTDFLAIAKGVTEGQRNDNLARLAGGLFCTNFPVPAAVELLLAWNESRCKPPLPHPEVMQTINSIAHAELNKKMGA